MASLNKACLIGNLGRDPETRHTQAGAKIVNFTLATSESWKDKSGERQERTEWHRVVVFNEGLAGVAEKYLRKGSKAYIEGKIQTRKWTDKEGVEKYTTEIVLGAYDGKLVLLDGRREGAGAGAGDDFGEPEPRSSSRGGGRGGGGRAPSDDLDDQEIPF